VDYTTGKELRLSLKIFIELGLLGEPFFGKRFPQNPTQNLFKQKGDKVLCKFAEIAAVRSP
jgi:hypothetical protein